MKAVPTSPSRFRYICISRMANHNTVFFIHTYIHNINIYIYIYSIIICVEITAYKFICMYENLFEKLHSYTNMYYCSPQKCRHSLSTAASPRHCHLMPQNQFAWLAKIKPGEMKILSFAFYNNKYTFNVYMWLLSRFTKSTKLQQKLQQ